LLRGAFRKNTFRSESSGIYYADFVLCIYFLCIFEFSYFVHFRKNTFRSESSGIYNADFVLCIFELSYFVYFRIKLLHTCNLNNWELGTRSNTRTLFWAFLNLFFVHRIKLLHTCNLINWELGTRSNTRTFILWNFFFAISNKLLCAFLNLSSDSRTFVWVFCCPNFVERANAFYFFLREKIRSDLNLPVYITRTLFCAFIFCTFSN